MGREERSMNGELMPYGIIGNRDSSGYANLFQQAEAEQELKKALLTGDGVVQPGDQGARALREQFLLDFLEQVSFEQDDAMMMKLLANKKVPSNVVEWADFLSYGGPGDDFVGETGVDGAFNVSGADDNFIRQTQSVKYMATQREIGIVTKHVNNTSDPEKLAVKGATLELVGKMNIASYFADAQTNILQFNGWEAQAKQWLYNVNPGDYDILFDAQGQPLSKELLLDIAKTCRKKYGRPTLLMESVDSYADTQKLLFPEARTAEGTGGQFGGDYDSYKTPYGQIKLRADVMLRANRPLVPDGNGLDGKPRSLTTADANSLGFTATPFTTAPTPVTPGAGAFYRTGSLNADTGAPVKPAIPTQFNNRNNLAAGSYFYAVAPVYYGREGTAWVYGEASAGLFTGAASIAITSSLPLAQITVDNTKIIGMGTTISFRVAKYRVYRAPSTAQYLSDFDYLCDVGISTTGVSTVWDNGYVIPGTDTAFLFTEKKNGSDGFFMAQLLPLLKRPLPQTAMSDRFAMLAFITPILKVPRHHIIIRNIGKIN